MMYKAILLAVFLMGSAALLGAPAPQAPGGVLDISYEDPDYGPYEDPDYVQQLAYEDPDYEKPYEDPDYVQQLAYEDPDYEKPKEDPDDLPRRC